MTYGTEVHKACEDYVGEGKPLAKNYQHFQPILDALLEIDGTRYPEHEMGLYRDGSACAFDDPERYVRGIVDLLIVDGDTAYIVDYKTGSNKYPDPKQLKLMDKLLDEFALVGVHPRMMANTAEPPYQVNSKIVTIQGINRGLAPKVS